MKSADILAHPSLNDCFPLVLLEAMSLSLPVISTFEGAIPEIVDNEISGFLVPSKDPKSLAEKLEILIKEPELRRKLGAAGRLKYENEFTLKVFESRLKDILEQQ
jgi:glycosyltransferase involved in cell wall biosynthesis